MFPYAQPLNLAHDEVHARPGDRLALRVDRQHIDLALVAGLQDVAARRQPDVKRTLVHDGGGLCRHGLVVRILNRDVYREALAALVAADVSRHDEAHAALIVGARLALADHAAVRPGARIPPLEIGEAEPSLAAVIEAGVCRHEHPADLRVLHRPAEEVAGLGGDAHLFALHVFGLIRLRADLVFGLAILGDQEADAEDVGLAQPQVDVVVAEARLRPQLEASIDRTERVERHAALEHRVALVVIDRHGHRGARGRQGVLCICVPPDDGLPVDRLAGAIDGAIRVDVAGIRTHFTTAGDAELPGADAVLPVDRRNAELSVRARGHREEAVPRVACLGQGDPRHAAAVGGSVRLVVTVSKSHGHASHGQARLEVGDPGEGIRRARLEGDVEVRSDDELARPLLAARDRCGPGLQVVDAGRQGIALRVEQRFAHDRALVSLSVRLARPLAHQRIVAWPVGIPGSPVVRAGHPHQVCNLDAVQAERDLGEIAIGHDCLRGRVRAVSSELLRVVQLHHRRQVAGAEPQQVVLSQGVPVGI